MTKSKKKGDQGDQEDVVKVTYKPTDPVKIRVDYVYKELQDMIEKRNKTYVEFNDRTLKTFIDDADKRLNSYVIDNEAAGKESWESNVALPTVRGKQAKLLAGMAFKVPDLEIKAFGEDMQLDLNRSMIAKNLIRGSYLEEENPILESFWEAWDCSSRGTIIKYEGYLKTRYKQKFIKSYDIVTGDIDIEEKEVDVDDKCISLIVPLMELYIKDFYIHDIQKQPKLCWVRYYSKDEFELEFGHYANHKFVKQGSELKADQTDGFYKDHGWMDRVKKNKPYEVVRLYAGPPIDDYITVANSVMMLDTGLLWKKNGKKVYPFAKTIWAPFVKKNFFYGNNMGNIFMGEADTKDTLWNTMMNKQYRNLEKPLLVGRVNRDALDLEDEIVGTDTKIYVDDVNQVRELAIEGINNADIAMLQLVEKGIEESMPSVPNLLSNKKATAREVVIADERLAELKTTHYEMMSDLWRQKYELRLANIQQNYPEPRLIAIEGSKTKKVYRTFTIDNATLDEATGEKGILAIQFRNFTKKQKKGLDEEVGVEREMMKMQGINYEKKIIKKDYLDNYTYRMKVISGSLWKVSLAKKQATTFEKLEIINRLFPQIFVANQEEFFSQVTDAYDDNPEKYLTRYRELMAQVATGETGGEKAKPTKKAEPKKTPSGLSKLPQE